MKRLLFLVLLVANSALAQAPCEFTTNVTDSLGTYRATKETMFYERNFGSSSSYIFFSLVMTDELPTLNVEFVSKSKDFIKANCLDKNSRMYLQLANGRVVTLMHMTETCGTGLRNPDGLNTRIQQGIFMFVKNSVEDLKSSPITMMRIRYGTETVDYPVRSEITSELDKKIYHPERYFQDNLRCIFP